MFARDVLHAGDGWSCCDTNDAVAAVAVVDKAGVVAAAEVVRIHRVGSDRNRVATAVAVAAAVLAAAVSVVADCAVLVVAAVAAVDIVAVVAEALVAVVVHARYKAVDEVDRAMNTTANTVVVAVDTAMVRVLLLPLPLLLRLPLVAVAAAASLDSSVYAAVAFVWRRRKHVRLRACAGMAASGCVNV